jgi:hypothetical protein
LTHRELALDLYIHGNHRYPVIAHNNNAVGPTERRPGAVSLEGNVVRHRIS